MLMSAILLSLRQLADAQTLRLVAVVTALTVVIFGFFGIVLWRGLDHAVADWLGNWGGREEVAVLAALAATAIGFAALWFLFRAVAMAIMGLFLDGIIESVEEDHYPDVAARGVPVSFWHGMRLGLRSALRTLGWNLVALPAYLLLLVTGIGTLVLMVIVNALVLQRDLEDMAAARHPSLGPRPMDPGRRWQLGMVAAIAFVIPLFNFVAPIFAAALAVHMLHMRQGRA